MLDKKKSESFETISLDLFWFIEKEKKKKKAKHYNFDK